jgi:hypothetical protein
MMRDRELTDTAALLALDARTALSVRLAVEGLVVNTGAAKRPP